MTLILAVGLQACATTLLRGPAASADEQYTRAMENLGDGLYPEAIQGFGELKTKFPYSKYAALADLRVADTNFERGKYIEAVDGYRAFLKYHPAHEEAPYAMFRIGESYFEQIPGEWWFLPPPAEKDQANIRLAISSYRDFLTRYPTSKQAEDGRKRLDNCRRKLADHEIYVANFYYQREHWVAAALRAEGALRDYPGLGLDVEALWLAAHSRFLANEPDAARVSAERLVKEFPGTSEASKAQQLLASLPPPPGDLAPATTPTGR